MTESRRLLPPSDIAGSLGVEINTLAKWRCRGEGPAYLKIGSRIMYEQSALDAWLESRRRRSTSEAA
jgi:hypothetical protein